MHSVEADAFQVGFVGYVLDCMVRSTDVMGHQGLGQGVAQDVRLQSEYVDGEDGFKNCFVRDDLWIEGLRVPALIDDLLKDS